MVKWWLYDGIITYNMYISIYIYIYMYMIYSWWLSFSPALWKKYDESSVGMMTFPIWWKVIKFHGSKPPTSFKLNPNESLNPSWLVHLNYPTYSRVKLSCLLDAHVCWICPVLSLRRLKNHEHRGALHVRHGATQNQIFALRHLHELHEARMVLRAVPQMLEMSFLVLEAEKTGKKPVMFKSL